MTIQEVTEATAIDVQAEKFSKEERLRGPYDLLKLCTSLVTLFDVGSDAGGALKKEWGCYRKFPPDVKILQFSHFSVKEFILGERAQRQLPKNLSINFASSHVRIVQMRLIYHMDFNGGGRAREFNHDEYPLLACSALHWSQHWNTVTLEDKCCVEQLLLRLFDTERPDGLRNYPNLYNPTSSNNLESSTWSGVIAQRAQNRRGLRIGSALYYAYYLGLWTIVSWILDSNPDTLGAAAIPLHGNFGNRDTLNYFR
jgi:hypothetical protein